MKRNCSFTLKSKRLNLFLLFWTLLAGNALFAQTKQLNKVSAAALENLQVEYTKTPIGIDVKAPRFSWQMISPAGKRNYAQKTYQIEVRGPNGKLVWNTNRISGNNSVGIEYTGAPLAPATRYTWKVTVGDQAGAITSHSSWFETGFMNPGLSAWDGANWIGGSDTDLVLYAQYFPVFNLNYDLAIAPGSNRASIVLAANDPRLLDKNKNIFAIENKRNESYFKVELDISGIGEGKDGKAKINIYRAGYTSRDTANKPVKTFLIKSDVINADNKNNRHNITIHNEYGTLTLSLDGNSLFFIEEAKATTQPAAPFPGRGNRAAAVTLNPLGAGHDVISYGMLCDIGFSVEAGQSASFSHLTVSNTRKPGNTVFEENLATSRYDGIFKSFANDSNSGLSIREGKYHISGGAKGISIVANPSRNSMPMLRAKFSVMNKKVAGARLYITSRGIYEVFLNGKRVGNDYYNPGLTQYNITHLYQTYDVTGMIANGQNAIGAMLGEGWWSGMLSYGAIWNHFGDRQSLLAKLVITYNDGSKDVVTTNDKDWKYYNKGPVVYSSLDMGEIYDATREAAVKNWSTAGYNDRDWKPAVIINLKGTAYTGGATDFRGVKETFNFDKLSLIGQIGEPAGVFKTITATSVKEVRKGVYVYNMGQNFVGVPRIGIKNGKAGKKITLRFCEVLYPALKESGSNIGMIMTENYRAALSQDMYTMVDGEQVFQPEFTSHGFQYIEISGIDAPLPLGAVQGLSISSIKKLTAGYATSNAKVNKLWSNLVWSNVDNFLTIPTDCPQRNERMGWSGDISIFSRTATYLSNSDQFLRRHMFAMRDLQTLKGKFTDIAPVGGGFGGVLWGSAGITVAWEAYQQYNDIALLNEHYNAMSAYMAYVDSTISKKTGLSTDAQLGDWLGPQNNQLGPDFLVTAYHIFDLGIMVKVAEVLNKEDDARKFRNRYDERKAFFNTTFVNADKKTVGLIGGGIFRPATEVPEFKVADTQTSYAVGLALGAFSDENIPYMVKNLKESVERENKDDSGIIRPKYSLMTGFIGTAWISKALSDHGYSGIAYKVLQNNQYPSWLYAVDQGATTIWERLNGYTVENGFGGNNSMNSFNHYSFGAIGQWMMAYSLGIQRDEPGFKKFILQPEPDPTGQMTWAKGYYDSDYGRINSGWKVDRGVLTYFATVPPNTTATLYLPAASKRYVTEGGKPAEKITGARFIRFENGNAVFELSSGNYTFSSRL
ncbi:MAG: Bacterial alpha-L-rhamnosidase [Mucilaginibacter sp.]|nr:Bacterial alpha-L-rhamnosidase [Mucilaginibacter sp.]